MTELRDVLVVGIVLVAALAVSACLEIVTDLEEGVPVATTSADETAANATDADNRIEKTPVATYTCNRGCEK
jgi:hypothetical protein